MLSTTHLTAPCLTPTPAPTDDDSIMHSRQWIHENKARGVECPTCGKHVEEYRRTISSAQATALEAMHTKHKTNYVNLNKMRNRLKVDQHGELTKLAHWGLIQQHHKVGGSWAVTPKGASWIQGEIELPQSIYVYQGELTGQCVHRVLFSQAKLGITCHHGHLPKNGIDPYREDSESSDHMYRLETLAERRSKIARANDSEHDLFGSLVDGAAKIANPLRHEFFYGDESISKAKEWIERKLEHHGGFCPSCDKLAAYNRTRISDSHARLLIEMYKRHGMDPVHVPTFMVGSDPVGRMGHASESAHRGLLSVETTKEGGVRSGVYRLTNEGIVWILNLSTTPETIWSYNRFARKIENEKQVKITEVFDRSDKYNYVDLMGGAANHLMRTGELDFP